MIEQKDKNDISVREIPVRTIPGDFYGGANPVVIFKNVQKEITTTKTAPKIAAKPSEIAALEKATAAGGLADLLINRKFLAIVAGVLFLFAIASAAAYYWWQERNAVNPAAQVAPIERSAEQAIIVPSSTVATSTVVTTTDLTAEIASTTAEEQEAPPIAEKEVPLDFSSMLLGDSEDMDNDDVTDKAEEYFGTDPGNPDSDDDGFNDGHEIFNLYNPLGTKPMKIINSGKITDFENPAFKYKLYYPNTWAVGIVDNEYRDILFSTLNGENIEVRVFDILPGQEFSTWFGDHAPDQNFSDLVEFSSVFKEQGFMRKDFLVYYFIKDGKVYVIAYHNVDPVKVDFRSVIKMMARSFRYEGNNFELPEPIVEGEQTTTSAEEIMENSELEVGTTSVNI